MEIQMPDNASPSAGEVRALANQLLSWADHLSARAAAETLLTKGEQRELALGLAEAARDAALLRSRFFPGIYFGNLAWDVIIELFIRTEKGFRVSLDGLALEPLASAGAIRRSVRQLREQGLIVETPDRFDPTVTWLSLSDEGAQGMTALLIQSARPVQAQTGILDGLTAIPPSISRSA